MQVSRFAFVLLPAAFLAARDARAVAAASRACRRRRGQRRGARRERAPGGRRTTARVTQRRRLRRRRALFKIAVAPPPGDAAIASNVVETASRDFTLSSMFQVLDPKSFTANLEREGLAIDPASWRNVGAEGVVKGNTLDARRERAPRAPPLRRVARLRRRPQEGIRRRARRRPRRGPPVRQRGREVLHRHAPRRFGSRLVFSATTGRGQKGIFGVDSDGQGLGRMQAVSNVALAPAVGPGGRVLRRRPRRRQLPALQVPGNTHGHEAGGPRLRRRVRRPARWRSSSRRTARATSGRARPTARASRRSRSGGLNTHPAFGPGGQLAYVSNAGGNPQIYVDGKRVSFRGTYNMAPVWCNDPEGAKILFMGRDGGTWDIFSIDPGRRKHEAPHAGPGLEHVSGVLARRSHAWRSSRRAAASTSRTRRARTSRRSRASPARASAGRAIDRREARARPGARARRSRRGRRCGRGERRARRLRRRGEAHERGRAAARRGAGASRSRTGGSCRVPGATHLAPSNAKPVQGQARHVRGRR